MRRVVTGHDEGGVGTIVVDGQAPAVRTFESGVVSTLIWCTDKSPADISKGADIEDMGLRKIGTAPPAQGTRFSIVQFPPGNVPHFHRTESVDYAIVLSGIIDMQMDGAEINLKAGDVVVQRGTNHAWINRGNEVATIAFVLIDATPLGIGTPVTGSNVAS
jgi:quercetin dioxygenase-like cupin family protein